MKQNYCHKCGKPWSSDHVCQTQLGVFDWVYIYGIIILTPITIYIWLT